MYKGPKISLIKISFSITTSVSIHGVNMLLMKRNPVKKRKHILIYMETLKIGFGK